MRRTLWFSCLLVGVGSYAQAQGMYYNEYFDDPGDYGGDPYIDTISTAYPGSGCGGSIYAFSSLNGDYLSGSAFYPNQVSLPDSVWSSPDSVYSWSFGYTVYYSDPYSGQCTSTNVSWGFDISVKATSSYWTTRL